MKKIGFLTSSRADFGIYLPLLYKLREDKDFEVKIIAFGTHLSSFHGYTISQIEEAGFDVAYKIESMLLTDLPSSISTSMGLTTIKFSDFWMNHVNDFDLIFCLGDRYEMFSAVIAGVPFQIPFAHLHGGETTLGAIDNVFRHSITMASKYHFVSTELHAQKVIQLINQKDNVYNVGALSLDNLLNLKLLTINEFESKWGIDLNKKTILTTFHPETINLASNKRNINNLVSAIKSLSAYQFLITMPNADTAGNMIRNILKENFEKSDRIYLIENLGSQSYFTALKYASLLLGNTSSGIIEAASFGKYVINLGDRQLGRSSGNNIIHIPVEETEIIRAVAEIEGLNIDKMENIYFNGGATTKIINVLKTVFNND
ncbi:MAG: UDP-N-acetylglucosamine 2-epimerase (hydrolyzing) [Pedobacter sp.]|nr:MAG: UDP-N-acetylglucosamine 2-epimerase (hydrolyzing) [Pedobacter sp.]